MQGEEKRTPLGKIFILKAMIYHNEFFLGEKAKPVLIMLINIRGVDLAGGQHESFYISC